MKLLKVSAKRAVGKLKRKLPKRKKRYIDTTVRFRKGVKPYY